MSPFDITRAQPNAWSILSRSFKSGRVSSTYLFTGEQGLGHWPLAVEFAALLNCLDPQQTDDATAPVRACRVCRHCRMVYELNFEGLQIVVPVPPHKKLEEAIDATSEIIAEKKAEPFKRLTSAANTSIPIDMAREVAKRLSRKSSDGITRVVLFYQMEKMRTSSADALLKLIEEPPPDTVLILTTERPEMLLPTIQSRSQKVRLRRLPDNLIAEYLVQKYELSQTRATLIARLSQGIPGRAIDLTDTEDEDKTSRRAVGMLLFKSLFREPGWSVISQIQDMVNLANRGEVTEILNLWQLLLRDAHYFAVTGEESELINVDFAPELKQLSPALADPQRVSQMIQLIKNTLADSVRNVHIQTALAALSLKLIAIVRTAG